MRFTMICIGSTGDVRPYVLLGKELKARGHDVGICAFLDFQPMIETEGLRYLPLIGDAKGFMSNIMKPGTSGVGYLSRIRSALLSIRAPFLADLEAACEGADALISTYFGGVARSIAEVRRIPYIQTHYSPMDSNEIAPIPVANVPNAGRAWNRMTYHLAYLFVSTMELMYLSAWRRERGMTPRKLEDRPNYVLHGHRIPVLYAMSPLLMPRPRTWGENIHMTGFWLDDREVEFTPTPELQAFLDAGKKPVYIGFGSMTSGDMGETLNIVLEAIRESGVRAIVSTGWGDVEIPRVENVYVAEGYIPHDWLFRQVAAVVHHGGAGTTAAGLLAFRPTLVIPFGGDQPFWAMRVRMLGLGPKPILRDKLTVAKLAKALHNLVTVKSYQVAARELGARLRLENGISAAADIIEQDVRQWTREVR